MKKLLIVVDYQNDFVDGSLGFEDGLKISKTIKEKILKYFSLDSPLLEQNLRYTMGECTSSYTVDILGLYTRYADFKGYYVTVKNFDSEIKSFIDRM